MKKRLQAKKIDKPKKIKVEKINYGPTNPTNQFKDVSKAFGLEGFKAKRFYVVDLNGDNLEDLVLIEENYSSPVFLVNRGNHFSKPKNIFFETPVKASFLHFADFNKDGVIDVLVAVFNQKTELTKRPLQVFHGKRRRGLLIFEKSKTHIFKDKLPVSSVSVFDYDHDGNLDFYVGTWFDMTRPLGSRVVPDRLYTFKNNKIYDISGALQGESDYESERFINAKPTIGVSHCDINHDGIADILTSSSAGNLNKLWLGSRVKGNIIYRDVGVSSGFAQDDEGTQIPKGAGNSTFSVCRDYNNDQIFDVATGEVSTDLDPETKDRSSILTGKNPDGFPEFIRTEYAGEDYGLWRQSDLNGTWLDYNNDGLVDLLVENSGKPPHTRLVLFKQNRDHSFEDIASKVGLNFVNPAGAVTLDVNNDGLLDILVGQSNRRDSKIKERVHLYLNKTKTKNKSLKIRLVGPKGNQFATGTKVVLKDEFGNIQSLWKIDSHGPFASQKSSVVHFGVGESKKVRVEITWPVAKKKNKSVFLFETPLKSNFYEIEYKK